MFRVTEIILEKMLPRKRESRDIFYVL